MEADKKAFTSAKPMKEAPKVDSEVKKVESATLAGPKAPAALVPNLKE